MKRWLLIVLVLLCVSGCWKQLLRVTSTGEKMLKSPIIDATPLAPFAGLLGGLFMVVRNIAEQKVRREGGEVKVPEVKVDTRNVLSKISGSRKYVVATLVSAILVAVVNWYELNIDPATVAKIVAALFGTAVFMNGVEDAAEKLKS